MSDVTLWKFVKGADGNTSNSCELYHFYEAKIVHKRSIEYNNVKTIWRHFLRWDHITKKLFYYDGREGREEDGIPFNYEITKRDYSFDKENKRIYINIQPRDMLIWSWCYYLDNDNIELRQWEKKLCKFCDKNVRIHRNGCYDFKEVVENHKENCRYKNISKFGLQNKRYFVYHDIEKASTSPPRIIKSKEDWFVANNKKELTTNKKILNEKHSSSAYDINNTKSSEEIEKSRIRELINKVNYKNLNIIIKEIQEINNKTFLIDTIYNTYRTVKEHPHSEIIEYLKIETEILEKFKHDFSKTSLDSETKTCLKHKICLLNTLFIKNKIKYKDIENLFKNINNVDQVEIAVYFFNTDSKIGLKIGNTINNIKPFKDIINLLMKFYDDLSPKIQFTLDDLVEDCD